MAGRSPQRVVPWVAPASSAVGAERATARLGVLRYRASWSAPESIHGRSPRRRAWPPVVVPPFTRAHPTTLVGGRGRATTTLILGGEANDEIVDAICAPVSPAVFTSPDTLRGAFDESLTFDRRRARSVG